MAAEEFDRPPREPDVATERSCGSVVSEQHRCRPARRRRNPSRSTVLPGGFAMPTDKQSSAARKNVKKAAGAAKEKRTIAHLPKSTRTALGKQGAKGAAAKRQK